MGATLSFCTGGGASLIPTHTYAPNSTIINDNTRKGVHVRKAVVVAFAVLSQTWESVELVECREPTEVTDEQGEAQEDNSVAEDNSEPEATTGEDEESARHGNWTPAVSIC